MHQWQVEGQPRARREGLGGKELGGGERETGRGGRETASKGSLGEGLDTLRPGLT